MNEYPARIKLEGKGGFRIRNPIDMFIDVLEYHHNPEEKGLSSLVT